MDNKNNAKLAKRYASSLVESLLNSGLESSVIIGDLENVKSVLNSSNELFSVILNPVISAADKEGVIDSVFEKECIEIVRNFLKLLVQRNRFNLIFQIIDELKELIYKINNIVKVDITSAVELEQTRKNEIQTKLNSKLNKKVEINYAIDNSIVAGLIFKSDDNVLDTSFIHKLEDLKQELIK